MESPATVEKYLKGIDFPADKSSLIDFARMNGATDEVISTLMQIPDRDYMSPVDVAKGLGEIR